MEFLLAMALLSTGILIVVTLKDIYYRAKQRKKNND